MDKTDFDLCIIGGGINGAGIARDAAGRGLSVLLLEAKDLAQGTSSMSTKLIHGGLRYLEFFEFKLVRESLQERERLMGIAPHILSPMEFVLPHNAAHRPFWLIRLGLFLYDHLARRRFLPGSRMVNLKASAFGVPLADHYTRGFVYSDCWVDDARLVVLNAMDAAEKGAKILTRCVCTKILPKSQHWAIEYQPEGATKAKSITASMVVNAAGPWVRKVLEGSGLDSQVKPVPNVRLVKGSHIIIPRAYAGEQSYILQQSDGRVVFVIPYEDEYTLIGTTEEDYEGDLYEPRISGDELRYLCAAYSTHFEADITRDDVLWTYSGVRPLFDDGHSENRAVSRDFYLHEHLESRAPMISVFGGKLTTYRVLAEKVMGRLLNLDHRYAPPWTSEVPLPGGDIAEGDRETFVRKQGQLYTWLPADLLARYVRSYGTRMERFLEGAEGLDDLGVHYGDGLYEAEMVYLIRYEWARTAEDILWRRSKLGLHVDEATVQALEKALPDLKKKVLGDE
ncbi:MAG: glycerol-3-phosphate dehydrogenase [Rhodospirillales bacterium]|nr:glycerol-3-phosphate dehydrogenase [Rhodospirillales bacterium]